MSIFGFVAVDFRRLFALADRPAVPRNSISPSAWNSGGRMKFPLPVVDWFVVCSRNCWDLTAVVLFGKRIARCEVLLRGDNVSVREPGLGIVVFGDVEFGELGPELLPDRGMLLEVRADIFTLGIELLVVTLFADTVLNGCSMYFSIVFKNDGIADAPELLDGDPLQEPCLPIIMDVVAAAPGDIELEISVCTGLVANF